MFKKAIYTNAANQSIATQLYANTTTSDKLFPRPIEIKHRHESKVLKQATRRCSTSNLN